VFSLAAGEKNVADDKKKGAWGRKIVQALVPLADTDVYVIYQFKATWVQNEAGQVTDGPHIKIMRPRVNMFDSGIVANTNEAKIALGDWEQRLIAAAIAYRTDAAKKAAEEGSALVATNQNKAIAVDAAALGFSI
jgi:hypothetical protein